MKRNVTGLIIAVIFAAVVLLSLKVHKLFYDIFFLLVMMLSAMEVGKAIGKKYSKPMYGLIMISIFFGYLVFYFTNAWRSEGREGQSGGITAFFGMIALAFLVCLVVNMVSKRNTMNNVVSTMFVLVYPAGLLIYTIGLNYLPALFRACAILLIFTVTPLTDMLAFLVGSTLRGPKLCPLISPKKTISGGIGGLIGGLMGGGLLIALTTVPQLAWFGAQGRLGSGTMAAHVMHCLLLGLGGAVCTQLGDLIASYIKRQCGIKDFGNLLPGHGGVMDRIDGMTINGVFVFLYFFILNFL